MLRISNVSLINIVTGNRIIPEFLQTQCRPINLYDAVSELLADSSVRDQQIFEQLEALKELDGGPNGGFDKASEIIKDTLYSHVAGSS